jgi:transcriptional regulator with XRE-family HTH domain
LERGLTQEELAARIRINRNYVGVIERQENSPPVAMLERIANPRGGLRCADLPYYGLLR